MPKNKPMHRTVSIVPAIYIQVAGGLKPALTKNSNVAGPGVVPTMGGMKKTAQMMRRTLNSLSRLNLSASDMTAVPPVVYGAPPAVKIALPDAGANPSCPSRVSCPLARPHLWHKGPQAVGRRGREARP